MKIVKINTEYITLGQFLKITDYISSGGMAKFFLSDAIIYVDEVLENRRGKKLYNNTIVKMPDETYKIVND